MPKRLSMKTFRLVPLVLAGFCGYLHTVINRRFDEMGELMSSAVHGSQHHSLMDAPSNSVRKALGGLAGGGATLQEEQQQSAGAGGTTTAATGAGAGEIVMPSQRINMAHLQGPAVDKMESSRGGKFEWKPSKDKDNVRVIANSAEYQQMLLHYTMNLLPNHRDPSASKGNNNDGTTKSENDEGDDVNNPKPYKYNDIDMIVPASGQDNRLQLFAERLGVALTNFNEWYENERKPAVMRKLKQDEEERMGAEETDEGEGDNLKPNADDLDLKFRLLVTRYPQDEQKTEEDFEALLSDLSQKTTLPRDQIKLIRVGQKEQDDENEENQDEFPLKFNRAHARNVLHQNACHEDDCIVSAFDVDMQVLPIFFHRALLSVTPHVKAYFPIVFSEFNPETVQLVQDFLHPPDKQQQNNNNAEAGEDDDEDPMLEPFSRHRGLWRDFGYGMYVLAGSDAKRFRFNEEHQGWGHEDNDFYKLVHNNMRVDRQREHGLIHAWHGKNCTPGRDIITQQQWLDCINSRDVMEGSALGLLLRPPFRTYKLEDFPGLPSDDTTTDPAAPKYKNTKVVPQEFQSDEPQKPMDNSLKELEEKLKAKLTSKGLKVDSKDEAGDPALGQDDDENQDDDEEEDNNQEPNLEQGEQGKGDGGENPDGMSQQQNDAGEDSAAAIDGGENSAANNAGDSPEQQGAEKQEETEEAVPGNLQGNIDERRRDPDDTQLQEEA